MSVAKCSESNESKINPRESWAKIMTEMLHQAEKECAWLLKRKRRKQRREAEGRNHLKGKREKPKRRTSQEDKPTAGDCPTPSISISSVGEDGQPYARDINIY